MKVVCEKIETLRTATACANIKDGFDTAQLVKSNGVPKGNVLEVVRTAGIMAAQKTPELIPLRRQIPIDSGVIDSEIDEARITVESSVKAIWKTGVEMEAFTAATIASLTIYDMLKPLDTALEVSEVKLIGKRAGTIIINLAGS